jgi:HK97 family phage prohead protease
MPETATAPLLTRSLRLQRIDAPPPADGKKPDDNELTFAASSETPVDRWGDAEILMHQPANVRLERLRGLGALLINHDHNQRVGTITKADVVDGRLVVTARFLSLPAGQSAKVEAEEGSLRGVSVQYAVHAWEIDEEKREIRATDWEPYEVSLTPIPADPSVGIGRQASADQAAWQALRAGSAGTHQRTAATRQEAPMPSATQPAATPAAPTTPTADETATQVRSLEAEISASAEGLGLRASDYVGKHADFASASRAMFKAVELQRNAKPAPIAPAGPSIEITADSLDKAADHLMRTGHIREIAMRWAGDVLTPSDAMGRRGVQFIMNNFMNTSKRAAEVSGNFTMICGLASQKALLAGFAGYVSHWGKFCNFETTGDYKTFRTSGLYVGDLGTQSNDGDALGDLTIDDAGGSGTLTMRGNVVQLTEQAIYNDELGQFFTMARRLGLVAARKLDKLADAALEAATFSGATAALALSEANLKTAWASYIAMTDAAGQKIGHTPSRLIVAPARYVLALESTTAAAGETTSRIFALQSMYLEPVNAKFLTDSNDWYLVADPNEAPIITLLGHRDYAQPSFDEIDAGSIPSRKWMIKYPSAAITNYMNPGTDTKPLGGYKATEA